MGNFNPDKGILESQKSLTHKSFYNLKQMIEIIVALKFWEIEFGLAQILSLCKLTPIYEVSQRFARILSKVPEKSLLGIPSATKTRFRYLLEKNDIPYLLLPILLQICHVKNVIRWASSKY